MECRKLIASSKLHDERRQHTNDKIPSTLTPVFQTNFKMNRQYIKIINKIFLSSNFRQEFHFRGRQLFDYVADQIHFFDVHDQAL